MNRDVIYIYINNNNNKHHSIRLNTSHSDTDNIMDLQRINYIFDQKCPI